MHLGGLSVERRPDPPLGWVLLVSVLAIAGALVLAGLIFWGYGVNPFQAYATIARDTLGDPQTLPEILRPGIPLLLIGVGLVLAFRAQFYNIGGEGQLLAGTAGATWVALFSPVHGPWAIPAMFLGGALAGAAWGVLPTLLKLRLKVNEVITTLMMNYVAIFSVQWLIYGPWKGPSVRGFPYTDEFPDAAQLPLIPGTPIHWPTLLIGVLAAAALSFMLARTKLGFEIRVQGQNPTAARYAGISPFRTVFVVMLIAGGLAGIAGAGEVGGIHHRLMDPGQVSQGYGYAAIIVAWLARGSPLAAILTAMFLGAVYSAGEVMKATLQMPARVTDVFNGLILFCLIGSERLLYYRLRWRAPRMAPGEIAAPTGEPQKS
ncbi:MAG TPA: ABC transporter permease [bacterium]|jgi:simple sugar transport system permease protein